MKKIRNYEVPLEKAYIGLFEKIKRFMPPVSNPISTYTGKMVDEVSVLYIQIYNTIDDNEKDSE